MTHVVTQSCCNDASCVPACPVNCIHPTPDEPGYATTEMLYIDPEACVDCGQCVLACPVDAIRPDNDLSDADGHWLDLNAEYFADPGHRPYTSRPTALQVPRVEVSDRRLRVAIIGSGPSGCYAAEQLLACRDVDAEVHVFERLPTPWGLVRFGVAPDHQRTKQVAKLFEQVAGSDRLTFHLNVEVGKHLEHDDLLAHFHAVIYAVGAPGDVGLGVPGDDLPGSHSAAEFVAWYNGHPDFADRTFDLSGERAVVVGNGNVSLDVARVLASDIDDLRATDIADHALDALADSNIREVIVLGRRGPQQAAFSIAELIGLRAASGFDVVVRNHGSDCSFGAPRGVPSGGASATARIKAALIAGLPSHVAGSHGKSIELRFFGSPVEIVGGDRVTAVRITRNELNADGRSVVPTTDVEDVACGLVLRSIGYRGKPLPGVPFDEVKGTVRHDGGRVIDASGEPIPGVYATGWIKRGPSGVIGTNRKCARETVQALLDDHAARRLSRDVVGTAGLMTVLAARQPDLLTYSDWRAIDRHERELVGTGTRPRVKLTSVEQMVAAARSLTAR
ncbi:FAD-dependent oxidoreductase [Mycobacterium kyogaense]|uniref:FAD-dependent oxidoreductase n=1 Tax=Mycobacterium kyogaense TaxID=2212479 RepID=UPI000DAF05E7|nr:FAD-dependent oxidoreductase [Mycobacterium kyogaense]